MTWYPAYTKSDWSPGRPQGGTERIRDELYSQPDLKELLAHIDLRINSFDRSDPSKANLPIIVWFHIRSEEADIQWCRDKSKVDRVKFFVFVSHWQMHGFIDTFSLPPERCVVLKNAIQISHPLRSWKAAPADRKLRFSYISTPHRGLGILLNAWEILNPQNAELHIWSSHRLYNWLESPHDKYLFSKAEQLPNVYYRGIVPTLELRKELLSIDYLAYPSTWAETSCMSLMEAMSVGCRIICPSYGALPETSGGFARLYTWETDATKHAITMAKLMSDELINPWQNQHELSILQQLYARAFYDWSVRIPEWRRLLQEAIREAII